MTNDWPWALLVLLIAPAVGSFLGVLVDRLPRGQSLLAPSACATCKTRLRWADMVPLLSAIALRGRCRTCGAAFPGHLIRIEFAALLSALVAVMLVPGAGQLWLHVAFLWCLIGLFYADLLFFRLPDFLTGALFLLGMALATTDPARGWVDGLLSAAVAAGAFWAIRFGYFRWRGRHGLGLGDVKLMAGIGAALGWQTVPLVTLAAAALALVVVGVEALRGGQRPKADTYLPFGSYLTASAAILAMM